LSPTWPCRSPRFPARSRAGMLAHIFSSPGWRVPDCGGASKGGFGADPGCFSTPRHSDRDADMIGKIPVFVERARWSGSRKKSSPQSFCLQIGLQFRAWKRRRRLHRPAVGTSLAKAGLLAKPLEVMFSAWKPCPPSAENPLLERPTRRRSASSPYSLPAMPHRESQVQGLEENQAFNLPARSGRQASMMRRSRSDEDTLVAESPRRKIRT
jgi:hypothetical protein